MFNTDYYSSYSAVNIQALTIQLETLECIKCFDICLKFNLPKYASNSSSSTVRNINLSLSSSSSSFASSISTSVSFFLSPNSLSEYRWPLTSYLKINTNIREEFNIEKTYIRYWEILIDSAHYVIRMTSLKLAGGDS